MSKSKKKDIPLEKNPAEAQEEIPAAAPETPAEPEPAEENPLQKELDEAKAKTADEFVAAMKKAFPGRAGEDGLAQVAANLYK